MKCKWNLNMTLALLAFLLMISAASGIKPLLIAVASDDKEATSLVSDSAVWSRYYLLFGETLEMVQVVDNPFLPRGEGAAPEIVDYLAQKGVGAIVAGRFGPIMVEAMNKKGMKYIQFSGVAQEGAERAVNRFKPSPK